MLRLDKLSLRVAQLDLAKELNLTFEAGKVHIIIGPNGTGKSPLFRALFADLAIQAGQILLDEKPMRSYSVSQWRRHFGYMAQDIQLDAALTALEVVLLGNLDELGLTIQEASIEKALSILDDIGMLDFAEREMHTLSGGQRQMILFAQVLLREPRILLLDEPVSALDLHHQQVLLQHVAQQTKAQNWISILILHDLNLAAQYADQLIVLNHGQAQAAGKPSEVLTTDLIAQTYQVNSQILYDDEGTPFIRSLPFVVNS